MSTEFPNVVVIGGTLSCPEDHGPTKNSGLRVTATLTNPSSRGDYSPTIVKVCALGKKAQALHRLAEAGALVIISGRICFNTNGYSDQVVADKIHEMDELEDG